MHVHEEQVPGYQPQLLPHEVAHPYLPVSLIAVFRIDESFEPSFFAVSEAAGSFPSPPSLRNLCSFLASPLPKKDD